MKHFSLKWLLLCSFLLVRFGYGTEIEVYHSGNSTPDKFTVDATGSTFSTKGFREAFANATNDGDSVYIPAGTFKITQLKIENTNSTPYKNLKVHFNTNTVIFMSVDPNDYIDETIFNSYLNTHTTTENNLYKDTHHKRRGQFFLCFKSIDGLKISGNGIIVGNVRTDDLTVSSSKDNDPNYDPNFDWTSNWSKKLKTETVNGDENEYVYKATLLQIESCKNVNVKNIRLHFASWWAFRTIGSDNVAIDNVTVRCMPFGHSDGIDIISSSNVLVSNCYVSAGDDAFCVKSNNKYSHSCENITFTNCVMKSPTNGFKIGTSTETDIKNIRVVNCIIDAPDPISQITSSDPIGSIGNNPSHNYTPPFSGITIESVDGASVSDIYVDNIEVLNAKAPIAIIMNRRNQNNTSAVGSLENVFISNLTAKLDNSNFENDQQIATIITGIPSQKIKNVQLKNIVIETKGSVNSREEVYNVNEVPEKEMHYPENYHFRQWHTVTVNNGKEEYTYDDTAPQNLDYLPGYGFFVRHVDGFTMDNVVIKIEDNDIRPPLVLTDVQNVSINPGKFVRVNGNGGVRPLFVSKYETTELEYRALMSENSVNESHDMYNTQSNHPMTNVTWYDAINYCNQKSKIEGLDSVYSYSGSFISDGTAMYNFQADISKNGYRLPTNEEWEFLYLGGVTKELYNGLYFSESELDNYVCTYANSNGTVQVVGSKNPNLYGLYDMAGNVSEWVQAAVSQTQELTKGGSVSMWYSSLIDYKHSTGVYALKELPREYTGFRVVRNAPIDMTPINMLLLD